MNMMRIRFVANKGDGMLRLWFLIFGIGVAILFVIRHFASSLGSLWLADGLVFGDIVVMVLAIWGLGVNLARGFPEDW